MSTLRDTNVSTADETARADALREAMVAELRELKAIRSDRVADAFRTVPRHLFAPGATLEESYAQDTVRVKRDEHGEVTDRARSCLTEAGYSRVNVVLTDAEGGVPQHAPYDRIIVTVGAWDIPRPGPTSSPRAGG